MIKLSQETVIEVCTKLEASLKNWFKFKHHNHPDRLNRLSHCYPFGVLIGLDCVYGYFQLEEGDEIEFQSDRILIRKRDRTILHPDWEILLNVNLGE